MTDELSSQNGNSSSDEQSPNDAHVKRIILEDGSPNERDFWNGFRVERIVVKDLSFETPMGVTVFSNDWQPDYTVKLHLDSRRVTQEFLEIVLSATVTAKLEAGIAFLIEAQQIGVFKIFDLEGEPLRRMMAIDAPRLIFPYLRETVDNVVSKGGFPAVALKPPDFEFWHKTGNQSGASKGGET